MKIRILIVDDHPIVRAGLKQIISQAADMEVADVCSEGREALAKIRECPFDVVVLDITLPNGSGLEVLREIRQMKPDLPVLILSMHPEKQYALRTLKAGASGYLTKKSAAEELLLAIRTVYQGKKYMSSGLAGEIIKGLKKDMKKMPHENLTPRELEVITALAQGKAMKQIASDLNLSIKTVSTYRIRAMEKMSMESNAEIIRYFVENQLLP